MKAIRSIKEWFRARRVIKALQVLKKDGKKELTAICSQKSIEMALELSVKGVQQILDQEGIRHCFKCPERFGLQKIDGRWVCPRCLHLSRKDVTGLKVVG